MSTIATDHLSTRSREFDSRQAGPAASEPRIIADPAALGAPLEEFEPFTEEL